LLLYPSFGEPISKAKTAELTFALPIVAPGETPTATLQILQGGQKLAEIPLPLDKPAADGRLPADCAAAIRRNSAGDV
jgi:hypothetical protein